LKTIITENNADFTRWALDSILNWKNTTVPPNVIHVHGSSDNLLPYKYLKADHVIEGGTHLMAMDKAKEVSMLLKKIISG